MPEENTDQAVASLAPPDIEGPGVTGPQAAWSEISPEEAADWNDRLLRSNADLQQYPYWNESYRRVYLIPRYLAWPSLGRPQGFACILTLGPRHYRIGLLVRGPVSLTPAPLPDSALGALWAWTKAQGYFFLRCTHRDGALLNRLAASAPSQRVDAFPFYPDAFDELIVDQKADDREMLSGFDREVRRKLRRAGEAGFEITRSDSPETLSAMWALFEGCCRRKGFRLYRSREGYCDIVRRARHTGCAWVYAVYKDGRAVASSLVCLDGRSAHCIVAALDLQALQGAPSPSVLLHWHSMREMYRLGRAEYNFGGGPETVAQFKNQFSPRLQSFPAPVTLAVRPLAFRIWLQAILPFVRELAPIVKWFVSRIQR